MQFGTDYCHLKALCRTYYVLTRRTYLDAIISKLNAAFIVHIPALARIIFWYVPSEEIVAFSYFA